MARIAFFGLGNMGAPMAENLIKAGHELCVFDPYESASAPFRDRGVSVAETPIAAVRTAEVVISMLPAGRHVVSLYVGEENDEGIMPYLNNGALVIDSSTIDVDSVHRVHAYAQEFQIAMVDAPVSGGVAAAKAGTLTFMCGADTTSFESAKSILEAMGKNIFRAGDSGAGQIAKMCNNMLLAIHMAGTAEALNLGTKNGLDPKVLSDIMLQSSGCNWSLEKYNPAPGVMENAPASHEFKPGFTVELMLKDLGLAMQNSITSNAVVPMGSLARNLFATLAHAQEPNRQRDFSSIWEIYE